MYCQCNMILDFTKLQHIKRTNGGSIACQCPACAVNGRDLNGKNHLLASPNGKFACVVDNSEEHRNLILKIAGRDGVDVEAFIQEYKQPIPQIERIFPDSILDGLVKDYSYYTDKGIKDSILIELKSGVAFRGNMNGRYVFPIYDLKGRIHGFSGRAVYDNPKIKWKHMGIKSNWVYPAYFVHDNIKEAKSVILVESIGDLLSLMSAGVRNVLVLFGVNLHGKVLSYLIANSPDKIYIATNNDVKHDVGQRAAERISEKLANYFGQDKIQIKLPTKKDFGDMTEEEIKLWRNELC